MRRLLLFFLLVMPAGLPVLALGWDKLGSLGYFGEQLEPAPQSHEDENDDNSGDGDGEKEDDDYD